MRIIAGQYRGRNLQGPKDDILRPTTDMIKEAVFNVIQFHVKDANVLDLFAGSGALGIECLSRGAKNVTFVDSNKIAIDLIKKNSSFIKDGIKILNLDAFSALSHLKKEKFDIVFLDPPYATKYLGKILLLLKEYDLLNENSIIIFEHLLSDKVELLQNDYKVIREKKYGKIVVSYIERICG